MFPVIRDVLPVARDQKQIVLCVRRSLFFTNGICECRNNTYLRNVNGTEGCEVCNQTIYCDTCTNGTGCISCKINSRLLRNGSCTEPYHSVEVDYSVEIIIDQIFIRFYHPLLYSDTNVQVYMTQYLSDLSTQPRVLNIMDQEYYGEENYPSIPFTLQVISHSPFEWRRGILRYQLIPLQSFESFTAIIELKPKSQISLFVSKKKFE